MQIVSLMNGVKLDSILTEALKKYAWAETGKVFRGDWRDQSRYQVTPQGQLVEVQVLSCLIQLDCPALGRRVSYMLSVNANLVGAKDVEVEVDRATKDAIEWMQSQREVDTKKAIADGTAQLNGLQLPELGKTFKIPGRDG
jgi:hypothetical protein